MNERKRQSSADSEYRLARMDVGALLEWYERVRRPLPWRATRDPYALLVSEVMLQQTQALRVVPYYERWLARFPTRRRSGRARPCGTCCRCGAGSATTGARWRCRTRRGWWRSSGWPSDLTSLPGVGPYTAAAVSSFAWDVQVAAVDTNVRRVLSRRDGVERDAARAGRAGGVAAAARGGRRRSTRR